MCCLNACNTKLIILLRPKNFSFSNNKKSRFLCQEIFDKLVFVSRYQILSKECPEFQEAQYLPRDYTDKEWCVQFYYNPSRNKRTIPSTYYGNGRWEIQPKRYYDTLNVVIILKVRNDLRSCFRRNKFNIL